MSNINRRTLDLAREWAGDEKANWRTQSRNARAAVEVIQSLPDEWVNAGKVRERMETYEHARDGNTKGSEGWIINHLMVSNLESLLPDPAPRTMEEIEWDDEEHPYMEAVTVSGRRLILLAPMGNTAVSENTILVAEPDGGVPVLVPAEGLSPTGRYARLSLPDDVKQVMEESVEDYKAGRFVDFDTTEPATPRPEDVPVGEAWQVEIDGRAAVGYRNDPHDGIPWTAVYRDTAEHDWLFDSEVALVTRLVPETTKQDDAEQNDESAFNPAYIYRDKDGDEWEYIGGRWIAGDTHAKRVAERKSGPGIPSLPAGYGPYTRIEKEEADD